jgi:5-oxoprolinase (ATP-hydrolysing)
VKNDVDEVQELLKEQCDWEGSFQFIHHGTTTETNAVLEGIGAKTGLAISEGHNEVLAVQGSQIPGGLAVWIRYTPHAPIVPVERTM